MNIRAHLIPVVLAASLAACGGSSDSPVLPFLPGAANGSPGASPDRGAGDTPATPPQAAPDVAVTAQGSVQAVDRLGIRSYFGIPYAKPPVGALRWQAPRAPGSWSQPLANTGSAAPCLQTSASPFRLAGDSEDCLYLDVHAPIGAGPFPVMVWIHGGAFNTGGVSTYKDPSPLVNKGVIVVNIAYRLGAMGFLGHPALADADGSTGNYGIMDQQAALKWLKDNIAAFAGDKGNVTIFGESAGGMSVMAHLASPLSAGLFSKAIVQSGAYGVDRQLPLATLQANSTAVVNNAMKAAGVTCATVDADCLRGLPDSVVRNQLAAAFNASMSSPTPSIDGKVLTKSIKAAFIAGENHKVPTIHGTNENEYALFIAIGEFARRYAATPPNTDPADASFALSAAAYPATAGGLAAGTGVSTNELTTTHYPLANYGSNAALQPSLAAAALGTDVAFACPGLNAAKRAQAQNAPTWMYEFRDQTALPTIGLASGGYMLSFPQGAAHSYEIQYLFSLRDLQTEERRALQASMSQYWVNFARSGDPGTGGTVPAWDALGTGVVQGLDVTSGGGIKPLTATSFSIQHKCDTAWTSLTF